MVTNVCLLSKLNLLLARITLLCSLITRISLICQHNFLELSAQSTTSTFTFPSVCHIFG